MGVEGFEDGQEVLGMTRRLKALERPFSSPGPLMRTFGAVVQVATLTVLGLGQ